MTLWRTKPFTQALASIRNPCLFLYGREDTFARSNVDLWQESFTVELVDGVDHFWSNGRTTELQRRMRNWLSSPASQWDGTKQ